MSLAYPTPPLLKANWPLQDAADATSFSQVITGTAMGGANVGAMTLYPVGGPAPTRVAGPVAGLYGWRFPTTAYATTWPAIGVPFAENNNSPSCWGYGYFPSPDISFSVWFRRDTIAASARAIFGAGAIYAFDDGGAGKWNYNFPYTGFYFGNDQHLRLAISGTSIVSSRSSGIDSGSTYNDGEWHLATARFYYDDVAYPVYPSRIGADLHVDGVLVGSWLSPADWTVVACGSYSTPWFLGGGKLYRSTMDTHFPSTSIDEDGNLGACGADLYDARVYCGYITPSDIYHEVIPEPPTYDIIGNCAFPSTSRACSPISTSALCAPNSRVRLIPSNR